MVGLNRKFTCKKCKTAQEHNISGTKLYKINNMDTEFIPIRCTNCKEMHYVTNSHHIIDELTDEAKNKAYEQQAPFIGGSERARERFFKEAKFVATKEAVLTQEDIIKCECIGVRCY